MRMMIKAERHGSRPSIAKALKLLASAESVGLMQETRCWGEPKGAPQRGRMLG